MLKGILFVDYMPLDGTINADTYVETLSMTMLYLEQMMKASVLAVKM